MRATLTCLTITTCAALLAAGCASDPVDTCSAAAAHIAACTSQTAPPTGGTCEGDGARLAEQVLSSTCDDLSTRSTMGTGNDIASTLCIALAIPLFVTDIAENEVCCFGYQCQGSLTCRNHICHKKSAGGGVCEMSLNCLSGLACIGGKCAAPRNAGQTCASSGECARGLVCNPAGTCALPGGTGAGCDENGQCASRACIATKCAPRSGEGGPCDVGDDWDCSLSTTCIKGTCAPHPTAGGACDPANEFQCPSLDQTCWQGTCEPRHALGGPCQDMFDCKFSLFCINGQCSKS